MAYSVDWMAKVISVPDDDLTLVSGTEYVLPMDEFLGAIRQLEAEEGLWAPQILDHTNTKVLSGTPYAPFDEIINGYQVQFTGPAATRVNLSGSNNNLVDVLIPTGVAVVPGNSAGLVVKSIGSGLSQDQASALQRILDLAEADEEHAPSSIRKLLRGTDIELLAKTVTGSSLQNPMDIKE